MTRRRWPMTENLTPDEQRIADALESPGGPPVVEPVEETIPGMEAALDDTTLSAWANQGDAEDATNPAFREPDA